MNAQLHGEQSLFHRSRKFKVKLTESLILTFHMSHSYSYLDDFYHHNGFFNFVIFGTD